MLFNVRQTLLETAGDASFEARPEGIPPEHVEQHQNQKHQQRKNQQEEDEQAVSEGVVWGKTVRDTTPELTALVASNASH